MAHRVRAGSVDKWVFTLYDGSTVYNLTGVTSVSLVRRDSKSVTSSTSTTGALLSISNALGGQVTLAPNNYQIWNYCAW